MKNEKLREQCEDIRKEFNKSKDRKLPVGCYVAGLLDSISLFSPLIGEVYFSVDELFMPKACIWNNTKQDQLKQDNFNVFKTFSDCSTVCNLVKNNTMSLGAYLKRIKK